jgi:thymidine phosphorylase
MVAIGRAMKRPTVALLTDMNRPLGRAVGNAVEVIEAIECLKGQGPADLMEVTNALAAQMILLGGLERTEKAARARLKRALDSGAALKKFREIVREQGGDEDVIDDYGKFPRAARTEAIVATSTGFVADVDAMDIAVAAMRLGGARERVEDKVDHAVGITEIAPAGTRVKAGDVLCRLHVNSERHIDTARELAQRAFRIGKAKPKLDPLVRERIE